MSVNIAEARRAFEAHFDGPPEKGVRAPGRVNIIGEHTDYNGGFVLPVALEQETVILARRRSDRTLRAYAFNLDATAEASLDNRERQPGAPWLDYVIGVAEELAKLDQPLTGADILIAGDVPIGCGLSSSAALEMAALELFEELGGFRLHDADGPKLGQRVENDFLGLSSGIMDQFISRMGRAGHALFLDCRSLHYDFVPVAFPAAIFVIANTGVSRGLTASKYNERVEQCQQAVAALNAAGKAGSQLRDFSLEALESVKDNMDNRVYRRARHVITENIRTRDACDALQNGNPKRVGELMNSSDHSLREDYEVTSGELDAMTRIARTIRGCYGARMTGAGFGGCTINLVESGRAERFGQELMHGYHEATGREGALIISAPADGAGALAF